LDFRLEGYFFKAVESLKQNSNQDTEEITSFSPGHFAATAGLVLHAPMGPISLSVNYYDDEDNQLGVLLHVGFLLFNKHSME
jgi:NTE family protein